MAVSDSCATVREALDELVERFPDLGPRLIADDGTVRPFVAVMVDGRDIRHLDALATALSLTSELDIFPPVAGG
ncbi:MAG: MoaD/ThiS family protein [Chloroflexi bacterium]|nr:MoaD/ThiS family protein [Chloroflexota bacterium]MDA1002415.1 MoaD/ThiS family protein [Chloroflexota bacterium]